jgi:hypothetical protein
VRAVKGNAKSGVRSRARPRTGDDAGLLGLCLLPLDGNGMDGCNEVQPVGTYKEGSLEFDLSVLDPDTIITSGTPPRI